MIDKIKSATKSLFALQRIISREEIFKTIRKQLYVDFVLEFSSERILILSPHPDDETIGCAGAILKNIEKHNHVKVIQFTDGSSGFPDDFSPSNTEKKEMAKKREAEALELKGFLGIAEMIFLRYRDMHLVATKSLTNYLKQVVCDYRPTAIFVPSMLDSHSDHFETTKAFYLATKNISLKTDVFQYEVWSPLSANFYLDIDKEIDNKQKAIRIYKSQLKSRNYDRAIEGLNRYRGSINGKSKYAEGYLKTDLETFRQLAKLVY